MTNESIEFHGKLTDIKVEIRSSLNDDNYNLLKKLICYYINWIIKATEIDVRLEYERNN